MDYWHHSNNFKGSGRARMRWIVLKAIYNLDHCIEMGDRKPHHTSHGPFKNLTLQYAGDFMEMLGS